VVFLKLMAIFAARFLILAPMAFCIFVILASEEKMVRLLAVISLIVLEQAREFMLVQSMKDLGKKDRH